MLRARVIVAACLSVISLAMAAALAAGPATATPIQSTQSAASVLSDGDSPSPGPACGGESPSKPDGSSYTCTFSEDFTSSTLDSSKWMVATTAQSGFTGGECYVNTPNNISISDGSLHLTSRVEPAPFVCHSPYGDFKTTQTGASVLSYGRFAQTYGRFEFRARFPSADTPDFDSALWMYPQNPAYGGWPNSGEIDVAEWLGSGYGNQRVFPSVHYAGQTSASTGMNCTVPDADTAFHRYAVNWTATTMYFYYDDQLCFQHSWAPNAPLIAPKPFDKAFDLVMTQTGRKSAVAGSSLTMDVDWVRAWK